MRAFVELAGYADAVVAPAQFRPLDDGVQVRALPATVVLRTIWRTEPGDDDPPGYVPFARLVLAHAEPGAADQPALSPDLFRSALERWDGASIIFTAYKLYLQHPGEHRLAFPRAGVADMTLKVRLSR